MTCLSLPQHLFHTFAESSEAERPLQEEGESPKEELEVRSSARRRLNDRFRCCNNQSHRTRVSVLRKSLFAGHLPAIVGHQLANGLCAPLLI